MARLHLHPDRLEIALTPAEKLLARRKTDVVVPREAIRSATITDDPWIWVRGIRAPGTAIPLNLAVGQWKFHGGKDFLVIKGTKSAVVFDVEDQEFVRLIVTTSHAHELVGALRLEDRPVRKPRTRVAKPRQVPASRKTAKDGEKVGSAAKQTGSSSKVPQKAATNETKPSSAKAGTTTSSTAKATASKTAAPKTAAPKTTAAKTSSAKAAAPNAQPKPTPSKAQVKAPASQSDTASQNASATTTADEKPSTQAASKQARKKQQPEE